MHKSVTILLLVLSGFGAMLISNAVAVDLSVPDSGYIPPDNQGVPGKDITPGGSPQNGNMKPECVIDSSLFDGRAPQPPQPDEVSVGSFQCQV